MRIPIILLIALVCWLTPFAAARAEVKVEAFVDRTTVAPGESVELRLRVSGGEGEPDLSALSEFKVISRGTSSSMQITNGRMSRETTYNFLLIPQGQGRLTIPALSVTVKGQRYQSEPISITVTNQPESGSSHSDDKEVWVTAEVSLPTPYEGQPLTYTFRLFNTVQIDDARFQAPEFDGFTAKEIKDRRTFRKTIDGREAMVTEIDYVLLPLAAGPKKIEPAVLQVGIVRQDRSWSRSPFDDFFNDSFFNRGRIDTRVIQTDALQVDVQPLPPVPENLNFSGLVGKFDLRVEMPSAELSAGDSATLAVTLEGRGNLMDAKPPDIQVPPAFKAYADTPQEEINLDRSGYHGKKVFRTALVPLKAGRFELPAVTLTYFDVDQKAYRTLSAAAPAVTVAGSQEKPQTPVPVASQPLTPLKKEVTFTGRDILPLKDNLSAIQSRPILPLGFFLLGLAAPALLFGATVMVQRLRRRDTRPAAVMKSKALKALKDARKKPGKEFLTLLYQALTAAILAAAGRMGQALTWKEAEALLLENGRSADEARKIADLLCKIESSKFSGASLGDADRDQLLDRTRKTIRTLIP
jgi:hypothetical protein